MTGAAFPRQGEAPARQRPDGVRRGRTGQLLHLGPDVFLAHTQPGFEPVAWEEIAACFAAKKPTVGAAGLEAERPACTFGRRPRELGRRRLPSRFGITIFTAPDARPLRTLRTVENLFALVGYRGGLPAAASLDDLLAAARAARFIPQVLVRRAQLRPGCRSGHRLRYRVVAQMAGEHDFRRIDLQRAVERGIAERTDHLWRLAEEQPDLEFWAILLEAEFFLAVRLSDDGMRHREYKTAHVPGSLRPSVAAALAWLSAPSATDVVLDPLCGAGTILIERAHLSRYQMLIGCDRSPEALAAAQHNIGPRYKPVELHSWDAAAVPLPARSVSRIVTNLPWGLRHGTHHENRRMYPRLLKEFHRLVQPGGLIVLLTAETRLMADLAERGLFRPEKLLGVTILGAAATVYVWSKQGPWTSLRIDDA